ncbi:hypothetical protein F5Y19DRAFT_487638 [Xylariaceae sp. FL1651]|nr:hypothetical protein F5Y19DRAFT_487638 [Xylariaceae sp. FL1651]
MRLLQQGDNGSFTLTKDLYDNDVPPYAILSHTWGDDTEEVNFNDINNINKGIGSQKAGYRKIEFCGQQAAADKLQYFWVDSCCIDKSSSAELQEAITSMFRWYQNAAECYVYLSDVISNQGIQHGDLPRSTWKLELRKSRWFTRGWTLPELLAPTKVTFFSKGGYKLGTRTSLSQILKEITGIPIDALNGRALSGFNTTERMLWSRGRETKRKEDKAYSMLGIFGVRMYIDYGEGEEHAMARLCEQIENHRRRRPGKILENRMAGPLLESSKIFAQDRIFVREDVQSFLSQAFSVDGKVTAVLYGLPGVGKTVMARYFAKREQEKRAMLWIPSGSEREILSAFSEYSQSLTERDREPPDFVTVVGKRLVELFAQNWILIFDGLNDPSAIQMETFIFPNLPSVKILITSQNANICDRVNASHVMQVSPLTEEAAEGLLTMTATRTRSENQTHAVVCATEILARRKIVRDLGYLPVAISVVGAILRGSLGSHPISYESYLQRCNESRDADLEERPILTTYPSIWTAFDICFRSILSDDSSNSKRAAALAFFLASFEDASNFKDCIELYRLLARHDVEVQSSNGSTKAKVLRELQFLDQNFLRRSFDMLVSASFITGNWSKSKDDHVPYMEMHSLFKKWLRRKHSANVDFFMCPKLWLLGFGMYQQLEQTGVDTKRYKAFKYELQANMKMNQKSWPEDVVPLHETVTAFVLSSTTSLKKSLEHLSVVIQEQSDLRTYSDSLRASIQDAWDDQIINIDWAAVVEQFMDELDSQVEDAVRFDSKTNPNYRLKDFFLETLDGSGCLPIAFEMAAPYELKLGGEVELLEELKSEITHHIQSLLATCLNTQAVAEGAEICCMSGERRESHVRDWVKRWADDISEVIKRGLDQAFSAVSGPGGITEAPQPATGTMWTVVEASEFSASSPRKMFFVILRRVIVDVVDKALGQSTALDALEAKREVMMNRCEQCIRQGLGRRAEEIFSSRPSSAETSDLTPFFMLWGLAWGGRVVGGLGDWIGSVIMNSISRDLRDAVIKELQDFLLARCAPVAFDLAEKIEDDSGVGNIFLNWISSGWIDLPGDDVGGHEGNHENRLGSDVREAFGSARASAVETARSFYAGSQYASPSEAVLGALEAIFKCRRALHHHIMQRLSMPGLNDRTGLGPFFAMMFLEDCDKELTVICSILSDVSVVMHVREELNMLQQIEKTWRSQGDA